MGEALPGRRRRRDRGPPRLRDGGLPAGGPGGERGEPPPERSARAGARQRPTPAPPIEAVWRIESARLIAGLARIVRDVGLAEELAQDALVAALERWPESGVPDNPGAWLMATAKHRAIDLLRRRERATSASARSSPATSALRWRSAAPTSTPDSTTSRRRPAALMFTCCHPVLSTEARVALTLRLLGGLTTPEIARAFLVAGADDRPAHRPRQAHAGARPASRSRCRAATSWRPRLASVLEVIYLIFNEGYAASAGDDWMRPALCEEALRLGRILAELVRRPSPRSTAWSR